MKSSSATSGFQYPKTLTWAEAAGGVGRPRSRVIETMVRPAFMRDLGGVMLSNGAGSRAELRIIRLAVKIGGRHEGGGEVNGIVHDRRDREPLLTVCLGEAVEILRDDGLGAV